MNIFSSILPELEKVNKTTEVFIIEINKEFTQITPS